MFNSGVYDVIGSHVGLAGKKIQKDKVWTRDRKKETWR